MPVTIQHIEACEAQQKVMKGLGFEQIDTSDDQSVCWSIRFFGGDHFVQIQLLPSAVIKPSSVLLLALSSAFGAGQRHRAKAIRDLLTD